jgi:hypothetical protein
MAGEHGLFWKNTWHEINQKLQLVNSHHLD